MIPPFLPIACLPLLAANAAANTQTSDDERPFIADPIIVTAPGPARTSDAFVINTTAIERDSLVRTLKGSLGNTLSDQPGVSTTFFGQGASLPVLRGLGAERVQILTNGIGVIDVSATSPDHQLSANAIEAEKIEILRGPAALAYGGQAIGGVVNVIDRLIVERRPDKPVSGDLLGAYNNVNDGFELAGRAQFANGPVVINLSATQVDFGNYDIPGLVESEAQRAHEAAESGADHDDHEQAPGHLDNTFVDTRTLAGGLSFIGANDSFFGVSVRQQTSTYGLPGHSHEENGAHDADHEEAQPFIDLEHTRIELRGGSALNTGPFTDVNASLAIIDYEHTESEAPGMIGTRYTSEGVEGRVAFGHAIGDITGSFGLQCIDKKLAASGEEAFITPTDTSGCGVFLYETREWASGTGVEGGLRIERLERRNTEARKAGFNLFSGSFGLHHNFTNGWFLGGQVSYTERAPNESELYANGPHLATRQYEVGRADFNKETGLNFEASARWSRDSVRVGINLFRASFSDFIFLQPGQTEHEGQSVDTIDNLPVFLFAQEDASFIGGEIYGDFLVNDGPFDADWTFSTSFDLVEADLDDGGAVPLIPPATFNTGISARWNNVEIGADMTAAARQSDTATGILPTAGYQVFNLHASIDLPGRLFANQDAKLFIDARNITDEEIRFASSVLKDVAPAPGRNIRTGLRIVF